MLRLIKKQDLSFHLSDTATTKNSRLKQLIRPNHSVNLAKSFYHARIGCQIHGNPSSQYVNQTKSSIGIVIEKLAASNDVPSLRVHNIIVHTMFLPNPCIVLKARFIFIYIPSLLFRLF